MAEDLTMDDVDEFDNIDVGALIAAAMTEDDANDPLLESYQKYKGPNGEHHDEHV